MEDKEGRKGRRGRERGREGGRGKKGRVPPTVSHSYSQSKEHSCPTPNETVAPIISQIRKTVKFKILRGRVKGTEALWISRENLRAIIFFLEPLGNERPWKIASPSDDTL